MRYIDKVRYINFIKEIIAPAIIFIVCGIIILTLIIGIIENEKNEINEGTIVDKDFYPGGLRTTEKITYYQKDRYSLTIQGEKDGMTVEYNFYVSQEEYENYKIGDYYRR